jgi:hypothetical protein
MPSDDQINLRLPSGVACEAKKMRSIDNDIRGILESGRRQLAWKTD